MKNTKIKFIATLPPIQSAIQIDGQGDGGRIKLDISRQYVDAIINLQKLAGKRLNVQIEENPDDEDFKME